MELSRRSWGLVGGASVVILLLVTAYFAWPKSNKDTDNVKDDVRLEGDHNDIKTEQDKQYALIHIENRIKAETGSHLIKIREAATTTR